MKAAVLSGWLTAVTGAVMTLSAQAHELTVCAHGCDYVTVQSAVNDARSGDTIKIGAGTYFENVVIDRVGLVLSGAGEDRTTIDGRLRAPVFTLGIQGQGEDLSRPVSLVGMTITHGRGKIGGGVFAISRRLDLQYCIVASNFATQSGGGIGTLTDLQVTINHSIITHNRAPIGGGIKLDSETRLQITNSTVARNTADIQGGGLELGEAASATITNTTFSDNASRGGGGGIFIGTGVPDAVLKLADSAIVANTAVTDGGGIYEAGRFSADNTVIARNSAGRDGGGVRAVEGFHPSPLRLNGVFVVQNTAARKGGGISSDSSLSLSNTLIQGNHPDECTAYSGCP